MSSIGTTTGLNALFAAQLALQTAGNNIANAYTKGYSRQNVLFTTDNPVNKPGIGYLGTGVRASGIVRTTDTLLESRIRTQNQSMGRLYKETTLLSQVEDIFNEPSDGGLSNLLSDFYGSLNDLALDPTDPTLRSNVIISGQIVCDGFNTIADQLEDFRSDVKNDLENRVTEVNRMSQELAELNMQIRLAENSGAQANNLYDERNQLLKELNYIVDANLVESDNGNVMVLVDGRIIAGSDFAQDIEVDEDGDGNLIIRLGDDTSSINIRDGEMRELLDQYNESLPALTETIDTLATQFTRAFNEYHSTGVPQSGPFTSLKSAYRTQDTNFDGNAKNDVLANAGLPFSPEAGSLFVTVTDLSTGAMTQHEIEFDPMRQSLAQLTTELNGIPHMGAYSDSSGQLTLTSEEGYGFDFSTRLDPDPDKDKTFGSTHAMLSGSASYPVTMAAGDILNIDVDGTTYNVTFPAGGAFTATEMANEINSQIMAVGGPGLASVTDDRLVLTSPTAGSTGSLQVSNGAGNPAASLGLNTNPVTGSADEVEVTLGGTYTGEDNTRFRFEASGNGTIGVTEGLTITVYDDTTGDQVAVLDVGSSYPPGEMIAVADGVEVSFTAGEISSDGGDFFNARVISDSDEGGLLAALGLNVFFTGTDASSLEVRQDLVDDSSLLAGALSTEEGDNANIMRLAGIETLELEDLDGNTTVDYYSAAVGEIGLDKQWADEMYEVQDSLMTNLENQRASISGVSVDEEMLDLEKYQQMLEAATRFLQVMNEVQQTIMDI